MHEHCYVDPPPPQKRRKLRRAKIKKATEVVEEECSLQMEVVRKTTRCGEDNIRVWVPGPGL